MSAGAPKVENDEADAAIRQVPASGALPEDRVRPSLPLPPPEEYSSLLDQRVQSITHRFAQFLTLSPADCELPSSTEISSHDSVQHSSQAPNHPPSAAKSERSDTLSIDVSTSPARHFRARCRFAVLEDSGDGKLHYFLYEGGEPSLLADDFPAACLGAYRLMPIVMDQLNADPELRRGIKAAHFLTTKSGTECLVTLVYELPLQDQWKAAAKDLAKRCQQDTQNEVAASVMGRSKGVVMLEGQDGVTEELQVGGKRLVYWQVEGSFSNPNPFVNEKCLAWLCSCADFVRETNSAELIGTTQTGGGRESCGQLLELYCGNANHTCALAGRFRRVVAVEINKELCKAATLNLERNRVSNATVLCSPSHRFCLQLLGGYGRDAALVSGFETVLVDPPRAGLDSETCKLVAKYEHVMYISCNPDALLRDLGVLAATHAVLRFAVFDHFPFTRHIECGVLLRRRPSHRQTDHSASDPPKH